MALKETDIYTIVKENGVDNLFKNGEPTGCPKAHKLLVPNGFKKNGIQIMEFPCHSKCPFFKNAELTYPDKPDATLKGVYLECMDKPTVRVISENTTEIAKPSMIITK